MNSAHRRAVWVLCLFHAVTPVLRAADITDDFSGGGDNGWTRYDPLLGFGVGGLGSWTVTNETYRIQATGSTAPGTVGPARVGSFRTNISFAEVSMSVDVVNFDPALDQLFGILTRVREIAIGTVDGYALTYATRAGRNDSGEFEILRVADEQGTTLRSMVLTLYATNSYRFVFTCLGTDLSGAIYQWPDLATPIATLNAVDSTYTVGHVGVFTYDNSSAAVNPVDFTIDNFSAVQPRPALKVTAPPDSGFVRVTWPKWATGFELQYATEINAATWTPLAPTGGDDIDFIYEELMGDTGFFRLVTP